MSIYLNGLNENIDVKHVNGGIVFCSGKDSIDLVCSKIDKGYKVDYYFSPNVYESLIYGSVKELTDNIAPYVNEAFKSISLKVN